MKSCPYSNLPVTDKPHWKSIHSETGYVKHINIIGNDIIHIYIDAERPVILDYVDNEMTKTALIESGILDKPLHLIWSLKDIEDFSYGYKQNLNTIFYGSGPDFPLIVLYEVAQSCLITAESLAALVPENVTILFRKTYKEAIEAVIAWKSGEIPVRSTLPSTLNAEEEALKTEFLAAVARISWLGMLDQQVRIPAGSSPYYHYFMALANMLEDIRARRDAYEKKIDGIREECQQQLGQKNIMLNAQIELNKRERRQFEQEKSALNSRIEAQGMELTRISTAITEKSSTLHALIEQIGRIDIDAHAKKRLLEQCQEMIDTEVTEKQLQTELTAGDSEFLSKLQKKHPNLNQRELRISLMVKLNYDTREIARAVGISTRGMESIRYRMHKKLGLDKHKSIKTYLSELAAGQW